MQRFAKKVNANGNIHGFCVFTGPNPLFESVFVCGITAIFRQACDNSI